MVFSDWLTRFFTPIHVLLMMEGGIGFLVGISVGFVAKNFGRIIAYGIVGLTFLLLVLSYYGMITINYPILKEMAGMPAKGTLEDLIRLYSDLARLHIVGLSSGAIGFFIGWRVG
jgi:uncharacterized membrane protein (Fun14 family)